MRVLVKPARSNEDDSKVETMLILCVIYGRLNNDDKSCDRRSLIVIQRAGNSSIFLRVRVYEADGGTFENLMRAASSRRVAG